jgi:hypothetical protein
VVSEADPKDREKVVDMALRRRSPRGLIENVSELQTWVWPDDGPERLHALLMGNKPSLPAEIVAFWRDFARAIIEASGKNPDDYRGLAENETLGHVCAAARLIKQLDKTDASIRLAARDPRQFGNALREALFVASFVHQLTIADNETSIWKGEEHNKKLRENAANRSHEGDHNRERIQAIADEIWERRPNLSKKAIAVLIETGERARVKDAPEAMVTKANTIRRQIRKKVVTDVR